jgi:ATP-dependent HslUV protease ATP-binding subunit HslU
MERLVEEISFTATDRDGERVEIDPAYVQTQVGHLVAGTDLSKFIL